MKVKVRFTKPTTLVKIEAYEQMVAEVERLTKENKDLQDALVIAERNKCLRDVGWDMLHSQIANLQRENRSLSMDANYYQSQAEDLTDQLAAKATELAEAKALIAELNDQIAASESELESTYGDVVFQKELQHDCEARIMELTSQVNMLTKRLEEAKADRTRAVNTCDTATKAAIEMAEMLVKANAERDEARTEAEDLKLEVQERDFRVDELEKQNEWLRDKNDEWAKVAADQKDTIINYEAVITELQKDVKFWKKAADENAEGWKHAEAESEKAQSKCEALKKAVDEISEQSADFCAKAQYEEERADELEETNKKFYAQIIGQRDSIDHLQRQLRANEQEYIRVQGMYDELYAAANAMIHVVRK